ncbi:MAG: hypothetical protein K6C68_12015 [Ruminococcus sp.]|nr:hypothetical protein [Ruminococcus sp.]
MIRRLKRLLKGTDGRTKLIFLLGAAGVLLILVSDLFPDKKEPADPPQNISAAIADADTDEYRRKLEDELCGILSRLEGVSNVKVMISVSGTGEYIYAEQNDIEQRTDSVSDSLKRRGEIIIADRSGEKQPVLKKIKSPEIGGAAIVCSGASDPIVKERVINTVSAALGLSTGRISVEEYG